LCQTGITYKVYISQIFCNKPLHKGKFLFIPDLN
jgi:hypothetical protein